MTEVISSAKAKIIIFAEANNVSVNESILNVPIYDVKEFFEGRDQSGNNYSYEEAMEDMGDSEAFFLPVDDMTGLPAILYSKERMENVPVEDREQILIHEILHYNDVPAESDVLLARRYSEIEAKDEALSLIIAFYSEYTIEAAVEDFFKKKNLEAIKEAYGKGFGELILRKIEKMTIKEVKQYLE